MSEDVTPSLFFYAHTFLPEEKEMPFGLLNLLEFVLRRRRENKLASVLICSGFRLTFDWPRSPRLICGDRAEFPELLKSFEATGHEQNLSPSL